MVMKKIFFISIVIWSISKSHAQLNELYVLKKDSSGFELTIKGASHLASLPLRCISKEFPNKTNHTSISDTDHVLLPRQLHPAFFGCFDWHSCVHGHWMLIRLLKLFPNMPEAPAIRAAINKTITKENILQEVKYFEMPLTSSWERTYGWAWLLKLDEELFTWNDPDGIQWHNFLQPLTQKIIDVWTQFLPKQTYPNRTGVHPNTAFGLVLALDYARTEKKSLKHLTVLPVVSDRTDLQIVHLDGLSFSRSWCMKGLALTLPSSDSRRKLLLKSSKDHLENALPHVVSGNYGGEHWLASFATYALMF
jgi:hypothetical protein